MPTALMYSLQFVNALPALLEAGIEVKALLDQTSAALTRMQDENRDPSAAEWDALNAQIDALRAELHD